MTRLDDLPIRDDLRGKEPYGAPMDPVLVPLNVNENPFPVPAAVVRDMLTELESVLPTLNRYPDREFLELREHLADYLGHGLVRDQLWAANGSNEVLQQLFLAFAGPGRRVLGFPPSYSMHPELARGSGADWVEAPRGQDYELTEQLVVDAITEHKPDVVVICTPNNPTGTATSNDVILAAHDAFDGMVIVDEAYVEFAEPGTPSALDLLPGRPRVVVSRTMSKAFAFAGARLGYFAADATVVDAVRLVRLPYHLSAVTQVVAKVALRHAPTMLDEVAVLRAERDRIASCASELGYRVAPSEANFVLIHGFAAPRQAFEFFLARDILVRDIGIPTALRVSAGTPEQTDAFLDALEDYTKSAAPVPPSEREDTK